MRSGVGVYCVIVGVFMAAWWVTGIRRGALSRPHRSRPEIMLHLAAELVTGCRGCAAAGGGDGGVAVVGLGALLYTVIASPGYFIARHERGPAVMFAVPLVLTAAAITGVLLA